MPRVVVVDPLHPAPASLRDAANVLARGGVVAIPTDTLYGLAVDPWNAAALTRLFEVKGRPAERAVPLVACDQDQVERSVGVLTGTGGRLAAAFWPGPLTLVIEAVTALQRVEGWGTRVAVRVPAHAVARELCRTAGHPITATSANPSSHPPASTAAQVVAALGEGVDLVLDAGSAPGGPASTIVDVTGAEPVLVRAGAVPWERVLHFLQSP